MRNGKNFLRKKLVVFFVEGEPWAHMDPVRVYFLGAGALGVPVLAALLRDSRIEMVGIGTQPDRPSGRKRRLKPTPVGEFAEQKGQGVDKLVSVNATDFLERQRMLAPELVVVVSFGQILKQDLLELPKFGCFNVHASLLPRHRGASPINAAILCNDTETGISFMKMDQGLDTGPVYEMPRLQLRPEDTAETLEERLAELAAGRVADCIWRVCREEMASVAQAASGATYAAKLKKEDGVVDWELPAEVLERRIRAFLPWPRAYFWLDIPKGKRRIQITVAEVIETGGDCSHAGKILQADKNGWVVGCGTNALKLQRVIPEGRNEMAAGEFLRGCNIPVTSRIDQN